MTNTELRDAIEIIETMINEQSRRSAFDRHPGEIVPITDGSPYATKH